MGARFPIEFLYVTSVDERVISNYRILRQIGIGGMGIVYLAEHEVIERFVAIKLLRNEFIGDESLVTRFFNEARAAAAAKHPGIVEILDVGYDQGQAFIMMELIEGKTLGKYLRERERLSPIEAIDLTRQIASALSAAHSRNVVHRDLKPSNIMLQASEDPRRFLTKVFDFGIAKLFGENSSHTRTGILIGTPTYMSPEQCKGAGKVDHRSDLYSLGCILYLMLTGKRVFKGEGEGEIIAKHIFEKPVPPIDLVPISEDLNELVLCLLEKDPNDRYQTTLDLIDELDIVLESFTASERGKTDIFHLTGDSKLALPPFETVTPTPRAREMHLDSLDPDPDPATGTPLSTEGRTVYPEPTGIGKRRSVTAVVTLLVGVGALSLVLYLRSADTTGGTGAASEAPNTEPVPIEVSDTDDTDTPLERPIGSVEPTAVDPTSVAPDAGLPAVEPTTPTTSPVEPTTPTTSPSDSASADTEAKPADLGTKGDKSAKAGKGDKSAKAANGDKSAKAGKGDKQTKKDPKPGTKGDKQPKKNDKPPKKDDKEPKKGDDPPKKDDEPKTPGTLNPFE